MFKKLVKIDFSHEILFGENSGAIQIDKQGYFELWVIYCNEFICYAHTLKWQEKKEDDVTMKQVILYTDWDGNVISLVSGPKEGEKL